MDKPNNEKQTDPTTDEQNLDSVEHEVNPAEDDQILDEVETLKRELNEARTLAAENMDKYRRTLAEFSNYRKRQDRDKELTRNEITINVLRRLLPVLDDFERALATCPENAAEQQSWAAGIKLIYQKLNAFMTDYRVETIQAVGELFDPRYHSALLQAPSDEFAEGYVMQEIQKGYMIDDQVLRATLVQVSLGPSQEPQNEQAAQV